MTAKSLIMCAHCGNLRMHKTNDKTTYTCEFIKDIIPSGIVDISMDADACIRKGIFTDNKRDDTK